MTTQRFSVAKNRWTNELRPKQTSPVFEETIQWQMLVYMQFGRERRCQKMRIYMCHSQMEDRPEQRWRGRGNMDDHSDIGNISPGGLDSKLGCVCLVLLTLFTVDGAAVALVFCWVTLHSPKNGTLPQCVTRPDRSNALQRECEQLTKLIVLIKTTPGNRS